MLPEAITSLTSTCPLINVSKTQPDKGTRTLSLGVNELKNAFTQQSLIFASEFPLMHGCGCLTNQRAGNSKIMVM